MNIQSNEVYTVHLSAQVHGNAEHARWIKTRMCPTKGEHQSMTDSVKSQDMNFHDPRIASLFPDKIDEN